MSDRFTFTEIRDLVDLALMTRVQRQELLRVIERELDHRRREPEASPTETLELLTLQNKLRSALRLALAV